METLLVPGAHLELAPVFLVAAVLLALCIRRVSRRRRAGGVRAAAARETEAPTLGGCPRR